MKTKILTVFAIAVLAMGLIVYGRAHASRGMQAQMQTNQPLKAGYTVQYTVTENNKVVSMVTRSVKSNGEFLESIDYLDADGSCSKRSKLAGTIEQGAVSIDDAHQKLVYVGPAALRSFTEAELRASKHFDREDYFLGHKVTVERDCDDGNVQCAEAWRATDLGGEFLKFDIVSNNGNRRTKEATSVRLGEPSFAVPGYPIDNSGYQRIQEIRHASR
ncbi:MAG: hypothetical protein QOG23_1055 [Blastocatellia bacterium]|jgi:hypothetical protein|nr:hypothetical protein [Blastocatellia bacterium]